MTYEKEKLPDGTVNEINWGTGVSYLETTIAAKGVTAEGTWYSTYSWDTDDKTLTLDKPTQDKPPSPRTDALPDPIDITRIKITTWGEAKLDKPLEWSTKTNGYATIVFIGFAQTSGPVGTVEGP